MTRIALAVAALVLLVLAWPRAFGGATSYVVVSGVSMEPVYETGDLVIARTASAYAVGDVIAFRTEDGDVIHRIIGGNAEDGFVTQGDNVDRPDPYLPRRSDIRGRAVAHVPAVGAWGLRVVRTVPAPLLAAGAILLALPAGGAGRRRRRRRAANTAPPPPRRTPETAMSDRVTSRPRVQVAFACVVVAVVVLPSAVLAWRAPERVEVAPDEAAVRHVQEVQVVGLAPSSPVLYPDGRSEPVVADADGEVPQDAPPLLRAHVDDLVVTVSHEVVGAPAMQGRMRVDLVLRTGQGFELPLAGLDEREFTGRADAEVGIDLDDVDRRFERYLEEAGLTRDTAFVDVTPVVAVGDGTLVRGGPVVLALGDEAITVSGQLRTVVVPEGSASSTTASASLVGLALPVPVVRVLGTALVLGLLGVAAVLLRREVRAHPDLRIGLLHGSLLVDIEPDAALGGTVVRVTSIGELVRLARRDHRTILHQATDDGSHHYLVPDGEIVYEYVVDTEGRRAPGIGVPVPDDAGSLFEDVEGPDEGGAAGDGAHEQGAGIADTLVSWRGASAASADEAGLQDDDVVRLDDDEDRDDATPARPSPDAGEGRRRVVRRRVTATSRRGVVMVEDFTELTRIWMQDDGTTARIRQERLPNGGMRYSVVRNGREFVHEVRAPEPQGEDLEQG